MVPRTLTKGPIKSWNRSLFLLGLGLVDFNGLAGFILFLLVLAVLLLWGVYKFAQIILPAFLLALLLLICAFIPFHAWSKATLQARAWRRIGRCLQEIKDLERRQVPRDQIQPLEQRAREAAQALVDRFSSSARPLQKVGPKKRTSQQRYQLRMLQRDLEELRLSYGVVPDPDRWCRFFRLHLEWDSIRWLAEHPGPTRFIVLAVPGHRDDCGRGGAARVLARSGITMDDWWFALAAGAALLGFANFEAARNRRSPGPVSLLLSFTAGYLAYRHGRELWDDEFTRVAAVALVFCPASLVLGFLFWGAGGAVGRAILRLATFVLLSLLGLTLGAMLLEPGLPVLLAGVSIGIPALVPWKSLRSWRRQRRQASERKNEKRRLREQEREEAEQKRQNEARQEELLQALIEELRR